MKKLPLMALALATLGGCAIRTSGPARPVTHDLSDAASFGEVHAPTPVYDGYAETTVVRQTTPPVITRFRTPR
jgi:hypothetical protein